MSIQINIFVAKQMNAMSHVADGSPLSNQDILKLPGAFSKVGQHQFSVYSLLSKCWYG